MTTREAIRSWQGRDAHAEGEEKIGEIADIYLDVATNEPAWLAVKTGLFGSRVTFVPVASAVEDEDHVDVAYTKDTVNDAPNVDADGELSAEEERRLYEHYGLAWGEFEGGRETSGPETDSAMTRSEEELVVGKRREQTGRARLRKYVVTEDVQTSVPVAREEVRVEREPIAQGDVDEAIDRPPIREEEREVTLHAEEPVVEKRVVPKERVSLEKRSEHEDAQVSDELRKEQIEIDPSGR